MIVVSLEGKDPAAHQEAAGSPAPEFKNVAEKTTSSEGGNQGAKQRLAELRKNLEKLEKDIMVT